MHVAMLIALWMLGMPFGAVGFWCFDWMISSQWKRRDYHARKASKRYAVVNGLIFSWLMFACIVLCIPLFAIIGTCETIDHWCSTGRWEWQGYE